VHLVTVNDYLADVMVPGKHLYLNFTEWLLIVSTIINHSEGRKAAYNADITYGTNNEFGFDYLEITWPILRWFGSKKHNYAIVDEVDSVLIDDARTPLIISGPVPQGDRHEFNELKPKLKT
jgi:preprotein translocase subunit SecA